jgi:hypothetical protein
MVKYVAVIISIKMLLFLVGFTDGLLNDTYIIISTDNTKIKSNTIIT